VSRGTVVMVAAVVLSLLGVLSATFSTPVTAVDHPEEYVNILGGTNSRYDLSHGNTLPLIARPWGFNAWSPYTDTDNGGWFFHSYDNRFFGIRCTHQPSPWINDYGQFTVNAIMVDPSHDGTNQYSAYNPQKSIFSPYYFKTDQLAYATSESYTSVEFTSTNHGGMMQVNYPKFEENSDFNQTRRLIVTLNGGLDSSEIITLADGALAISGYSKANSGGVASQEHFAHHFVIGLYSVSDKPITSMIGSDSSSNAAWVDLSATDEINEKILMRIGTSFISAEQALVNMQREVGSPLTFDEVSSASKLEWRSTLSRVNIGAVDESYSQQQQTDLLTTFYSTLYRASLFPRQLSEVTADGATVHWSPYSVDGSVFEGPLSTDSGFWDAYSTVCKFLCYVFYASLLWTCVKYIDCLTFRSPVVSGKR
jgi:putative alpha-1,2-mannosidase